MEHIQKDRWFVSSQGITLGPLSAEAINAALKKGELLSEDKVCSGGEKTWSPLRSHPRFAPIVASRISAESLPSPPSPNILRKRTPVSLPKFSPPPAPALPAPEAEKSLPKPATSFAPPGSSVTKASETARKAKTPPPKKRARKEKKIKTSSDSSTEIIAQKCKAGSEPIPQSEELEKVTPATESKQQPELARAPLPSWEHLNGQDETATTNATPLPPTKAPEPIPARPAYEPVYLADPPSWRREEGARNISHRPKLKMEWKIAEGRWRLLAILIVVAGLAFFAGQRSNSETSENKTRDLKDFRLSDPSSPTTEPLKAGDPIPPLKAPTRPQRE